MIYTPEIPTLISAKLSGQQGSSTCLNNACFRYCYINYRRRTFSEVRQGWKFWCPDHLCLNEFIVLSGGPQRTAVRCVVKPPRRTMIFHMRYRNLSTYQFHRRHDPPGGPVFSLFWSLDACRLGIKICYFGILIPFKPVCRDCNTKLGHIYANPPFERISKVTGTDCRNRRPIQDLIRGYLIPVTSSGIDRFATRSTARVG